MTTNRRGLIVFNNNLVWAGSEVDAGMGLKGADNAPILK
jgi:hypothetical protein